MTDTGNLDPETGAPSIGPVDPTAGSTEPAVHKDGRGMDSRMMWVMMIGCCLAIPFAIIIGGAGLAGLAGASPWLIGVGVVLAIALLVTRRVSNGPRCETPSDQHG